MTNTTITPQEHLHILRRVSSETRKILSQYVGEAKAVEYMANDDDFLEQIYKLTDYISHIVEQHTNIAR